MSEVQSAQRQILTEESKKYYLDNNIQHAYKTVKSKVDLVYTSDNTFSCIYAFAPYVCKIIMPSILGKYEVYCFDELIAEPQYDLIGSSDEFGVFDIPSCVGNYLNVKNMADSPLGELFNIPNSERSGRLRLKFVFNGEKLFNVQQLHKQGYTYEDVEFVPVSYVTSANLDYNTYITIRSLHHFSYLPYQTYYDTRIVY